MSQAHALSKSPAVPAPQASFRILGALSFSHMVNDMVQSLILAMYPILKGDFHLSFAQIGLITLTYQLTASLLQPLVGMYTDRRPQPYSLPIGMGFTLVGLLVLSVAPNFTAVLVAASLVGAGSAIFHPESSRIARMASGGKHGMAQSFSSWEAMRAARWGRCSLRRSSHRSASAALRGWHRLHWSVSWC